MTEAIEYKGYWWRPSNPEKTVAGVLTYTPGEEISLELIGTLESGKDTLKAFMERKSETIIHGLGSNSEKITLVNCRPSGGNLNLSCPFPIIGYDCQFLVVGKHLDDFNQKCFFKAYVKFPALKYWLPPTALKREYGIDGKGKLSIGGASISFPTEIEPVSRVEVDENTRLLLQEEVEYRGDHYAPKIEQDTRLEIRKQNDVSIADIYSDIHLYEQFLSLATLQTVKCSEISLFDNSLFQEYGGGEKRYDPVKIIYVQTGIDTPLKTQRHNFLFEYKSIADQYPTVLKKWYAEKNDIAPIRVHLVDSVKAKQVFSSIDFLIIIQAIEGFWWRFRDENFRKKNAIPAKKKTDLQIILSELSKEFDSIDKIRKLNLDISSAVDSRHYYSHFMNKSKKPHTVDGLDLFNLTKKLRVLLICCVLNYIGFDYSQIDKILNNSNSRMVFCADNRK